MIKAIVVEDQPPAQRILQKYASDLGDIEIVGTYNDALSAMKFLETEQVDLMFLDIHLPKLSGMDFLKSASIELPQVILTTAFADYALESYEYKVIDYLLKPFSFARFVQAIKKFESQKVSDANPQQKTNASDSNSVMIKSGHDLIKIDLDDIQYIKSDSDYTELIVGKKRILSNHTLKYWKETLDYHHFCQIHKSYIINISHLTKVSGNTAYIGDNQLSIGRAYKERFLERWK